MVKARGGKQRTSPRKSPQQVVHKVVGNVRTRGAKVSAPTRASPRQPTKGSQSKQDATRSTKSSRYKVVPTPSRGRVAERTGDAPGRSKKNGKQIQSSERRSKSKEDAWQRGIRNLSHSMRSSEADIQRFADELEKEMSEDEDAQHDDEQQEDEEQDQNEDNAHQDEEDAHQDEEEERPQDDEEASSESPDRSSSGTRSARDDHPHETDAAATTPQGPLNGGSSEGANKVTHTDNDPACGFFPSAEDRPLIKPIKNTG